MLSRRDFFTATSLTLASSALFAQSPAAGWDAVRAEFDLDPAYTHLALLYMTAHPRPVRAAIEEQRRRLDANPFLTVERGMLDFEHGTQWQRTAAAIAGYIGADAQDVALTQNTTSGLALIYYGLPLKAGDEVLTTAHDHYAHHEAIRLAVERSGATWRKVALHDARGPITADGVVDRLVKAIRPNTRAVGVTWVHSSTGLKLPLRRIADALAKKRVLLIVDGVHGLGVEPPEIVKLGIDAFSSGTHKWLFGPRGTGFVWAKPEVWSSMKPMLPTFTAFEPFDAWAREQPLRGTPRASWFTPGGFQAFEHYWAVPAAIDFHRRIGPARITQRIHTLNEQAKRELAKMPNVTLYTPVSSELSSGIICFDVKGKTARAVVDTLLTRDRIVASTTPYRNSYARLAFGIVNSEAEAEKTLRAIRAL